TSYSLKAGGDAAAFSIDAGSGAVTLTGSPDFEAKSSYSFTVVATDAAGNHSEQAVSLAINNLDEVAPTVSAVTDNVAASVTNGSMDVPGVGKEGRTGGSARRFKATNGTVASVTQVDSTHYAVVVAPTANVASGNVALSLVAGGAADTAGNAAVAASLSGLDSQGIDTLKPTVSAVTDNVAASVTNG